MTSTTSTTTPSIFKMFYTFKRTQMLLESGWTNADGVIVSGVKVRKIERVTIVKPNGKFYNCVHVVYISALGHRCSQFISCRAYLQRATQKRKEESQNYKAYQDSSASEWKVYPKGNPAKTEAAPRQIESDNDAVTYRSVVTERDAVYCDCEDFEHQSSYFRQHPYLWQKIIKGYSICKHALCTLNQLGFDSLSSYLKAWKPGGRLNQLSVTMNRTSRSRSLSMA